MPVEHPFDSREAASAAAADRIAELLAARLGIEEATTFVVGGGTSPERCFELLSGKALNWKSVTVALSDERWVPNGHHDSNERLLRNSLLRDAAGSAGLMAIYQDDMSVDERCDSLQTRLPESGFACCMVGMGTDGHFASLFPGSDSLPAGLDPENRRFYIPVRTDASPHPRISMTLGAMLRSDEILLLFFGEEKMRVFEQAKAGDEKYPIWHLLRQQDVPVHLYWAP